MRKIAKFFIVFNIVCLCIAQPVSAYKSTSEAEMAGNIMKVNPAKGQGHVLGVLEVSGRCAVVTGVRTAHIEITKDTLIKKDINNIQEEVKFAAVKSGQLIEIWFDGNVLDKFVIEGRAKAIVIYDKPDEVGNALQNLVSLFTGKKN